MHGILLARTSLLHKCFDYTQNKGNKILEFVLLITGSISAVCGDDGKTYASICHLLQTSAGVQVEHSGRCDRSECSGGQVSV